MTAPEAPLFTDAFSLCQWLLEHFTDEKHRLALRIQDNALALLDDLVLALKNRDRHERLDAVDNRLITLRIQLRLAETLNLMSESQLLHCLEYTDSLGRQLGGWLRRLHQV